MLFFSQSHTASPGIKMGCGRQGRGCMLQCMLLAKSWIMMVKASLVSVFVGVVAQ